MPDSILFDGIDDYIQLVLGGTAFAFGPGTMAAIVKLASDLSGHTSPFAAGDFDGSRYGIYRNPSELIDCVLDGTEATATPGITVAQNWQLLAWTKATGSVAPRAHRYVYDTSTWTHVNSGTSQANSSVATGAAFLGAGSNAGSIWHGNVLIAGVWNTVLSDATIETLIAGLGAWQAAAPREAWRLDTMSAIQSFGTVGTADQAGRVGTSLAVGAAPAGWTDAAGSTFTKQNIAVIGP